jgi:hypothetical protein
MNLRSEMLLDAKLIMRDGLLRTEPNCQLTEAGYVDTWAENLLEGIDPRAVEADYSGKRGSELDDKFKAAHSSAALTVNSFGIFNANQELPIPGFEQLRFDGFEKLFPTGLKSRFPPHLDATAHNDSMLLAIESKCLEYFTPKAAEFSDAYVNEIIDERRESPWFREMLRLREDVRAYKYLDAAQLIKHAFGLAWTVKEKPLTLLYIFWEPDDALHHRMFQEHRDEIAAFATRVEGGRPEFRSMSYPELWASWSKSGSAPLAAHADNLRIRYGGRLGSYEGYSRVNGRKTDEGFWD